MMRKARTQIINKHEVDILVQEFSCRDGATFKALGNHSKETRWKVQAGVDTEPYEIKVHVDKTLVGYPEVWVECQGKKVFPESGKVKSRLREDFHWEGAFRGRIKGIGEKGMFEAMPPILDPQGEQPWSPAVIMSQRPEGTFDVALQLHDDIGNWKIMHFQQLQARYIREANSKRPLYLPMRILTLEVPQSDPLHATLKVSPDADQAAVLTSGRQDELVTHYFARQTPAPGKGKEVLFTVNKERTQIEGNIGGAELEQFLKAEAYIVRQDLQKWKRAWVMQIGPYAEHTIELERTYMTSKMMTLTIDGVPFVEAAPADIDCLGDAWECKFRFKGEKCLKFEVFQTNRDGAALDTTRVITKIIPYVIECEVIYPDSGNIKDATLTVNGFGFAQLPNVPTKYQEDQIRMSPQAFSMTYGEPVPWSVDYGAAHGLEAAVSTAAQSWFVARQNVQSAAKSSGFFNLFGCCQSADNVDSSINVATRIDANSKYSEVAEVRSPLPVTTRVS